jgi:hypothetical protein
MSPLAIVVPKKCVLASTVWQDDGYDDAAKDSVADDRVG